MYKKRIWLDGESIFDALSMNNIEECLEKMSTDLSGLRVPTVDKSNFVSNLKLGEKADITHTHKDYAAIDHTHSFYHLLDKIDIPNPVLLVPIEEMDNYYKKTQTYSRTEVDGKILAAVTGGSVDLSVYYSREEFDVIYLNIRKLIDGLATLNQSNAYIKLTDVYGKAEVDTKIAELTTKVQGFLKEYETKGQLYTRVEIDNMLEAIDVSTNDYVAVIDLSSYADLKHTYNKTYVDNSLDEKANTEHVADHKPHYITQEDLLTKADKGHRETPARIMFDDGDSLEEKYRKGTLVGGTKLETFVVDLFNDINTVIAETVFGDTVQTKGFRQLGLGAAKYRVLEIEELDTFRDQHGVKINYMGEIQITNTKKLRVIPDGGRLNPLQLGLRSFLLGYDSSILLQSTINRATYDNSIVDLSMCELTVHDIVVTDRTSIDGCNTGKIYLMYGFNNILKAGHRVDQEKGIDSSYLMNLELVGTRGIHGKTDATNECGVYVFRGTRNKIRNCIFTGFNGAGAVFEEGVNLEGTRAIECVFQDSVFGIVTKEQSIYNRVEQCTFADVDHGMIIATTGNVIDGCNLKNTDISVYGNIDFGMFLNTGYAFNSVDEKCTFRYVPHSENPSTMLFQGLSRIPNMITKAKPGTVFSGVHFENIAHIGADNQAVIANSFTTVDSPKGASEIFASVGFVDGSAEKEDIDMDAVFDSVPKTPVFEGPYKAEKPLEWDIPNNDLVSLDGKETILKSNGDFVPEFTEDGALVIKAGDAFGFEVGVEVDASKDTHMLEMEFKLDPESSANKIGLFNSIVNSKNYLEISEYESFMRTSAVCTYLDHLVWLGKDKTGRKVLYGIGRNSSSQLGNGATAAKTAPTEIKFEHAERIVSIACYHAGTILVLDNGDVYGAGAGNYGHLANDMTRIPIFTKLDTSTVEGKVLKAFGSHYTTYLLTDKNTVWSCGFNNQGQCGIGSSNSSVNVLTEVRGLPSNAGKILNVKAGTEQFFILYENGDVYYAGYNAYGQGFMGNTQSPIRIATKCSAVTTLQNASGKVIDISTGIHHSVLLCENGDVYTIGRNNYGQCGTGLIEVNGASVVTPNRVDLSTLLSEDEKVIFVVARLYSTYIITNKGFLYGAGLFEGGIISPSEEDFPSDKIWPFSGKFIKCTETALPTGEDAPVEYLSSRDSIIVCYADGKMTRLGTIYRGVGEFQSANITKISDLPKGVNPADVVVRRLTAEGDVIITSSHVYFKLTREYSPEWPGLAKDLSTATSGGLGIYWRKEVLGFDGTQVKDVGGSWRCFWVLLEDGTMYESSGMGRYLKLSQCRPDIPYLRKVVQKATDGVFKNPVKEYEFDDIEFLHKPGTNVGQGSVFFKARGKVWAFGRNNYSQLGMNNRMAVSVPTALDFEFDSDVIRVAYNEFSTQFLTANGSVYYVGDSWDYRLGNGLSKEAEDRITKLDFTFPSKVVDITCGRYVTFYLLEDNRLFIAGHGNSGTHGMGNTTNYPTQVENTFFSSKGITIKDIYCNNHTTIVVTTDNKVYGCGVNDTGHLGIGNTANQSTFQLIPNITGVVEKVCITNTNVWVMNTEKVVFVSGSNTYHQIHNTNTDNVITTRTISTAPNGEKIVNIFPRWGGVLYFTTEGNFVSCGTAAYGFDFNMWGGSHSTQWNQNFTWRLPYDTLKGLDIDMFCGIAPEATPYFLIDKTNKKILSVGGYYYRGTAGDGNYWAYTNKARETMVTHREDSCFETIGKVIKVCPIDDNDYNGVMVLTDAGEVIISGGITYKNTPSGRRETRRLVELVNFNDLGVPGKIVDITPIRRGTGMTVLNDAGELYSYGYEYYYTLGLGSHDVYYDTWKKVNHPNANVGVKRILNYENSMDSKPYQNMIYENNNGDLVVCGYNYNRFPTGSPDSTCNNKVVNGIPFNIKNKIKKILVMMNTSHILTTDGEVYFGGENRHGQGYTCPMSPFMFTKMDIGAKATDITSYGGESVTVRTEDGKWLTFGAAPFAGGYRDSELIGYDVTMRKEKSLLVDYFGATTKISKPLSLDVFKKLEYTTIKLMMDRILNTSTVYIDGVKFDEVGLQNKFEANFVDSLTNKGFAGDLKKLRFTCNRG